MTTNIRISNRVGRQVDPSLIFQYVAGLNDAIARDNISATNFAQAYTPTNRTRTTAAGLNAAVAANTPVIDHVGASLEPYLRLEPAAANILIGLPPTTQDLTLPTGSFTLQVFGAGTAEAAANTATITGAGTASTGVPVTFVVTVAGTVTITITTATVVWLTPGAIPSSYFAGAAAIGAELVTDGGFDAVTQGAALDSGLLTIGNCYKIASRTDGDFISAGAPDNNVGTYFNATTTGVGLLDGGDTANPITFTSWNAGAGFAPQATAGALTGKAQKVATVASSLFRQPGVGGVNKILLNTVTITRTAGTIYIFNGNTYSAGITTSGNIAIYLLQDAVDLQFAAEPDFVGTIDTVSVKEHGTVRLSEANTTTLAIPAAVAAAISATGTIVIKGRFAFARAAGVVTNILALQAATASGVYTTTTAGNVSGNDDTAVAEVAGAYAANVDWKIALKFPSSANKYRIGIDVAGAGIVWGDEANFDGAFTATANLILGYVLHGATWIKYIKIYDKVLTDAQINAMS